MRFYSTVAVLTIPLPAVPRLTQDAQGNNISSMASPSTIRFERGVYDTKKLAHILSEEEQIKFIKRTQYWNTVIFESPEPVKEAAKERSAIVGTQTNTQVLANRQNLPINKAPASTPQPKVEQPVPPVADAKPVAKADEGGELDPRASQTGKAPQEFATRNELVGFLVREKGVEPEILKKKNSDEIIALAKEAHGIDVVIKKD